MVEGPQPNSDQAMNAPPHVDASLRAVLDDIRRQLNSVVRGMEGAIELLLTGVLAGGHILIEDVPGVGKTTLAKALARVFDVQFARVQFTPDLLPADILGTEILNPADGSFSFHGGPVFTNVLLADEINRASPRTQSALLEAMNEGQVTVEGTSHKLPPPFFVVATQNPVDFQGTYPLPEAQLDRFLLRIHMGYPDEDAELQILGDRKLSDPLLDIVPSATANDILALQEAVRRIEVAEPVARYVLRLAAATRAHKDLELGISTRGALSMYRAMQARALLADRRYVLPDDAQALAVAALSHRVLLAQRARYGGQSADATIEDILGEVPVPA
jgi:MoxR-like ATPase